MPSKPDHETDDLGRRVPPPGWEYYTFVDESGCVCDSARVRRIGPDVVSCDEGWRRYRVARREEIGDGT